MTVADVLVFHKWRDLEISRRRLTPSGSIAEAPKS